MANKWMISVVAPLHGLVYFLLRAGDSLSLSLSSSERLLFGFSLLKDSCIEISNMVAFVALLRIELRKLRGAIPTFFSTLLSGYSVDVSILDLKMHESRMSIV